MTKRKPLNPRQIERERLLFRYSMALERGDFETVYKILREAEHDPLLDRMIRELDEAYALEIKPVQVTFSTNHVDHREERQMTLTTAANTRSPIPKIANPTIRLRNFSPLAAAVLAVVALSMALFSLRPPGSGQLANIQNATATPVPSLTFTPTPIGAQGITPAPMRVIYIIQPGDTLLAIAARFNISLEQLAEMNPTLDFSSCNFAEPNGGANCSINLSVGQEINISATPLPPVSQTICDLFILVPDGIDLYSRPELDALVVGHVPADVTLSILDQANGPFSPDSPDTIVWFYVTAIVNRVSVQGWVSARYTSQLSTNCPLAATVVPVLPAGVDPFMITVTAVIARATGTAETSLHLTATSVVEDATAFAAGQAGVVASILPPTAVPSCTGIEPAAPGTVNCLNLSATPIPTPTSMFFTFDGQGVMTIAPVGNIPANAPVIITSGYFDGAGWVYSVQTLDGTAFAEGVRDQQLAFIPGYVSPMPLPTLTATPTAAYLNPFNPAAMGMVMTIAQVGDIPPNTPVQVGSAYYDGQQWHYSISADGSTYAEALESQLAFAGAGVVSGFTATPTPSALCLVINNTQNDVSLRTQPTTSSEVALAGLLGAGQQAEVQYLMMRSGREIWYYVNSSSGSGWVNDDEVVSLDGCPSLDNGSVGVNPNLLPTVPPLQMFTATPFMSLTATPVPMSGTFPTFTATPTPVK